jgi:hypothetical protein
MDVNLTSPQAGGSQIYAAIGSWESAKSAVEILRVFDPWISAFHPRANMTHQCAGAGGVGGVVPNC